ncbi:MAG: class I SAM-dependent methyltransferase [Hyphomonadaceae bacterium]|nr:class I SAM-dependent methyltransferase [Hyphomonadaceae bacterium]
MHNNIAEEPQNQVWNQWNARVQREAVLDDISRRQSDLMISWLRRLERRDLSILDAGCGSGWMCARLAEFGHVTGVDLADEVLARAREHWPQITFLAGDFLDMDLPSFDTVISLEVVSHVPDQAGYMAKVASLLNPGGWFCIATQNRPVLELNKLPPPEGWYRKWLDSRELRTLLQPHFDIVEMTTVEPRAKEGVLRWLAAHRVRKVMNALTGGAYQRALEHAGFGWSIVCLARKR